MAEILSQVCALQKQYGKTQAELETLVEGFSWVLADYPMPKIIKAFREYVISHSDIPAPSDIIKLIKEDFEYNAPTLEKLREYKSKGIILTPRDEARLSAYQAQSTQ